jgi:hypothetical protein
MPAGVIPGDALSSTDPLTVGLCVLNPTGLFFNRNVPYDKDGKGGSWHWPERA